MARPAGKKTKTKAVTKEVANAIKAFKASDEVEEFYRFVHENNLRDEARILTKLVLQANKPAAKRKSKILQ